MTADLNDEIRRAGHSTARRWAGIIEADDAEQEIWARLLESNYVERISEMEPGARAHVLGRIGSQVASQYRDDYEVFSGQVNYGTDEVHQLLESDRFRGESLHQQLVERSHSAEGFDLASAAVDKVSLTLSEWMDLSEALGNLRNSNRNHFNTLMTRYLHNEVVEDRKQVQRAVDNLTREMNRVSRRRSAAYEEGPGTRRVISNDQANHTTKEAA